MHIQRRLICLRLPIQRRSSSSSLFSGRSPTSRVIICNMCMISHPNLVYHTTYQVYTPVVYGIPQQQYRGRLRDQAGVHAASRQSGWCYCQSGWCFCGLAQVSDVSCFDYCGRWRWTWHCCIVLCPDTTGIRECHAKVLLLLYERVRTCYTLEYTGTRYLVTSPWYQVFGRTRYTWAWRIDTAALTCIIPVAPGVIRMVLLAVALLLLVLQSLMSAVVMELIDIRYLVHQYLVPGVKHRSVAPEYIILLTLDTRGS